MAVGGYVLTAALVMLGIVLFLLGRVRENPILGKTGFAAAFLGVVLFFAWGIYLSGVRDYASRSLRTEKEAKAEWERSLQGHDAVKTADLRQTYLASRQDADSARRLIRFLGWDPKEVLPEPTMPSLPAPGQRTPPGPAARPLPATPPAAPAGR